MKKHSEIASNNFNKGYNCAQSVLAAFCDEIGMKEDYALKLASSFGGGMGRMREVCGAVSAMFMIAGILKGYNTFDNDNIKQKHYELIQDMANEFKKNFGTIICRDLLNLSDKDNSFIPSKRNEEYYKSRPCEEFIKKSSDIIEKYVLQ